LPERNFLSNKQQSSAAESTDSYEPVSDIVFSDLALRPEIMRAIDDADYQTPTPIQAKAIPKVLRGGDLLAAAQTGTGKTAGFTLPILELLSANEDRSKAGKPRCLILTPTRELAAQINDSVKLYGKHLPITSLVVFGGVSINPQISALRKSVDILIATPGRLLDLCGQGKVDLASLDILVLDEADRMLDMGFIHDIKRIIKLLPEKRQTLLFSATFSDEIRVLAKRMLDNPDEVSVARRNTASELVEQTALYVDKKAKRALLAYLIKELQWHQTLVFTRTKHGADKLVKQLGQDGIQALAIHGNKSQNARTRALSNFKDGSLTVLVATDIAARGLDIDQLPNVVNYELPNVPEDYVHRIGRTGRAGMEGQAVSLVNAEEVKLLKAIERLINRSIDVVEIDGYTGHNESVQDIEKQRAEAESRRPPRGRGGNRSGGRQSRSRSGANSNHDGSGNSRGKSRGKPGNTRRTGSGGGGGRNR